MKEYVRKNGFSLQLLLISIFLMLFCSFRNNPDGDAYFLIENGRWIWEHKAVPFINPWNVTDGMGIIVQQWSVSLLNFAAYHAFGLEGMWVLAVLMNGVFLAGLAFYCRYFCKNDSIIVLTLGLLEVLICPYVTTRPYQVTMALSLFLLGILFRMSDQMDGTEGPAYYGCVARTALYAGVIALIQANWQLALYPILYAWPLCFAAPSFDEMTALIRDNGHVPTAARSMAKKGIFLAAVYISTFLFGLCNPYGLDGLFYLWKGKGVLERMNGKIMEISPIKIFSIFGALILLLLAVIIIALLKKKFTARIAYLTLGCCFMAPLCVRNAWLSIPATVALALSLLSGEDEGLKGIIAFLETTGKKKNAWFFVRSSLGILLVVLLLCYFPARYVDGQIRKTCHLEAISYLSGFRREDIKLYTTFNTGAMMEFAGFRVYVDARPEIYSKEITRGPDQFTEWYEMTYGPGANPIDFLLENGFTHVELDADCKLDAMLMVDQNYEEIHRNDSFVLYEKTDDSPK